MIEIIDGENTNATSNTEKPYISKVVEVVDEENISGTTHTPSGNRGVNRRTPDSNGYGMNQNDDNQNGGNYGQENRCRNPVKTYPLRSRKYGTRSETDVDFTRSTVNAVESDVNNNNVEEEQQRCRQTQQSNEGGLYCITSPPPNSYSFLGHQQPYGGIQIAPTNMRTQLVYYPYVTSWGYH